MKFLYTNFPKQYGKFLFFKNSTLVYPKKFLLKFIRKIYFGSKDQDKWVIEEIYKKKKFNGYFIDLAATDGINENNTYVLEKKYMWKGITIEANNFYFKKLKKNRSCICLNCVIGEEKESIKFIENGPTGGVIGNNFDNNFKKRSDFLNKNKFKIKKKKSYTLFEILKKNKSPKIINYLSLDVEGGETIVLKNFPFNKYIFETMTIERPSKELNKILFKNGYIFVKNFKADTFYVHRSLLTKKNINIKFENFKQLPKKKW